MLNHIVIMGRLTRDPELRYTRSQVPVASFTVAVDRDYSGRDGGEKQTDFIDCSAWRSTGEFVNSYFRRGSMIVVSGSLQSRKWQDRDGHNRVSWEINADSVYFGESRRSADERGAAGRYDEPAYAGPSPLTELPPGTDADNPFTQSRQTSLDDEDGDLPF